MLNNVVVGWLLRRALEVGGLIGTVVTLYMQLDPASQAVIQRILTGEWKTLPIGSIITLGIALWGYTASFRQTVRPKVVTKTEDGQTIEVAQKDLPTTTKEAVKTSAPIAAEKKSARKTIFEHLGIFGK